MTVGLRTLVLNQNYMPISIFPLQTIPAEDAITRVMNGTCHVVTEYDRVIRTQNQELQMRWPSVIARQDSKMVSNHVKLSREFIYYRDHAMCMYCSKPLSFKQMTIDHVLPKFAGGRHTWENVASACTDCNTKKGHSLPKGQWKPIRQPVKPTYWQMVNIRKKFPLTVYDPEWLTFIGEWEGEIKLKEGVV